MPVPLLRRESQAFFYIVDCHIVQIFPAILWISEVNYNVHWTIY
jgi:hypothetical protein